MTFLGMPTAPRGVGHLRGDTPFPAAAERALGDSQLRRNLGHATATIRGKRIAAVAELDDWEQLRAAGAAIKDDVLANLPEYLTRLEEQVTAHGGLVHWARDANEANSIITSLSTDELDRLDGVLTTCAVAIAVTGTIILDHTTGQGRRALTLIPDYHLVIVRTDQIVHSVPDAITALDPRLPMTWISGPSATSDIELSRVEGVHGPRRLAVVIATP